MGGKALGACLATLGDLQPPATGPAAWTVKAWIGVCVYLAGFLLVAWIVWRMAGPGEEDGDDLGNER